MTGEVVVTGAGGYLGGLLAHAYAARRGAEAVRVVVRRSEQADYWSANGFSVMVADLEDPDSPQRVVADAELVVHAAARLGRGTKREFVASNAHVSGALATHASAAGARLVFISSIEAYGRFAGRILTEDQPHLRTSWPYSESKWAAERRIAQAYAGADSNSFTIVRPGAIYGPRSPYWTHRFLTMAARGSIGVLGHGGRFFGVYESDVVEAIIEAGSSARAAGNTYNLVHDEGLSWWDWAQAHHQLIGRGSPRRQSVTTLRARSALRRARGRSGYARRLEVELRTARIPHDRARRDLGWRPTPFADAITNCEPAVGDRFTASERATR